MVHYCVLYITFFYSVVPLAVEKKANNILDVIYLKKNESNQ